MGVGIVLLLLLIFMVGFTGGIDLEADLRCKVNVF
jgi:hypothetical protein